MRCCEEIRELSAPIAHGAYYEVRPPGLDGTGEISLRDLVKFVLAMRPDRIVVGEVRGAEAFELTRAINAGCGFMCTVHANSGPEALNALVNAALMAGENVTERVVRRVFSQALDVVVHVDRDDVPRGAGAVRRQVTEITAVVPTLGEDQTFEPIFVRGALGRPLEWTGALPPGPRSARRPRAAARRARPRPARAVRDDRMRVLAALAVGTCAARSSRRRCRARCRAAGREPAAPVGSRVRRDACEPVAAAGGRRCSGSARSGRGARSPVLFSLLAVAALTGSVFVAVVPAVAVALLPRAYFGAAPHGTDARGAGCVARRAARHRRVGRRRPLAHAGGDESGDDRAARAARRLRAVPAAGARARDRARARSCSRKISPTRRATGCSKC